MNKIQLFNISPAIPPELNFLETLSYNLWWCWNPDAIELFRRINPQLWREARHNPLAFLSHIPQKRLETLAEDDGFLSHLQQVSERFDAEVLLSRDGQPVTLPSRCIAYFSFEYGIHESIGLYSGGLGCLAGDHLKTVSDLNLPLVAVGLLYRQGYFQQYLNNDGWQQETYSENEIHRLPLKKACDAENRQIQVSIPLPMKGELKAIVWRVDVGRVPLYLLDANIPDNTPECRKVTANLYVGDRQIRLRQELLLGIGGFRALISLGYDPVVCHMNEGHAAFMSLGRISHLHKTMGLDMNVVLEIATRTNVFTTHTPVPAGNETFDLNILKPHLEALEEELGIDPQTVISWGETPGNNQPHELSMTILALRMAQYRNGVSRLHGKVARKMWLHLWPGRAEDEIPIRHISNGVHISSWLSADNVILYDRYLGPEWRDNPSDETILAGISQIPDEELWRAHELGRSRLIRTARELVEKQFHDRNATQAEIAQAKSILDHDTLTIGCARRFATYKRLTLLLKDPKRLEQLLSNEERPVQLIFAGKAHPADNQGKDLIKQIVYFARNPRVRRHIAFLENYDMYIARSMIQGADLWLNMPRRPLEASGTSGMKASINGGLHMSTLDGWWEEGYNPDCGWAIGHGEEYEDNEYQDTVESHALYNLLENEVIPCFYDRPESDIPTRWTTMMRMSMKMAFAYFTSCRMVSEYNTIFYKPAFEEHRTLIANNAKLACEVVKQHERLKSLWKDVKVEFPNTDKDVSVLHVGDKFRAITRVHLNKIRPDEVEIQVYYGPVSSENIITESYAEEMTMVKDQGNGTYIYSHEVTCRITGRYGFTTRVTPRGSEWKNIMPGLITWADGS